MCHVGYAAPYVNTPVTTQGLNLLTDEQRLAHQPHHVEPGQWLEFCGNAPASAVRILVRDAEANANMGTWTFDTLRACST